MTDHSSHRPELRAGLILAKLHYKIVPIGQGQKYPPIQKWQEAATDDLDQVAAWLAETNYGIGWAMGEQPNGKHLFCLDIDGEEGVQSLMQLLRQHGDSETFDLTCQQLTGSGGFHYVFEAPYEIRNSAKQFAPSVDIRGEGGQIVCGPTIHPNGTAYRWLKGPKKNPPQLAPQWVLDRIAEMAEPHPQVYIPGGGEPVPHRGTTDEETPMGWLNRTFDGFACLLRLGWREHHRKGDESHMVRPGKEIREGSGGVYHHDTQRFNVFTTGIPPEYGWVGKTNADGGVGLTNASLWMVENGIFDVKQASSAVRKMMPKVPTPARIEDYVSEQQPSEPTVEGAALNLPDEFWEARPVLAHIRQAAFNRMMSPDAVFGSLTTRIAASIPPNIKLPAIIGTSATFDYIACIVARSSGGKSASNGIAADLFPGKSLEKWVLFDAPVGSGEGLINAFMGREKDDKNKPTGDPSYKFGAHKSIHLTVDEGTGLVEQQSRSGTTIIQTMCSAWSGKTLGQLNASVETKRLVPAGKRRVAATINIQTSEAPLLWESVNVGLPKRIMFHWAHAELPDTLPEWPGALDVPFRDGWERIGEQEVTFCPEAVAFAQNERRSFMDESVVLDDRQGHLTLVRLKLTGILSILDGRLDSNLEDWELAGIVVDTHLAVLDKVEKVHRQAIQDVAVTKATSRGRADAIAIEAHDDHLHAAAMKRIMAIITAKGPLKKKQIKEGLKPAARKADVFNPAFEDLVSQGMIVDKGDGLFG